MVVGYLDRRTGLAPAGRAARRGAAGRRRAAARRPGRWSPSAKHHLPNYGVFDEYRYFVPGDTLPVFRLPAADGEPVDVAIAICEDLWQDGGPVAVAGQAGRGPAGGAQRLAVRAGQGRHAGWSCASAGRAEAGAALAYVEHGRRPGRAGLRRRLDHRRRRRASCWPAGPQFEEALVVADLELPPRTRRRARPGRRPTRGDGTDDHDPAGSSCRPSPRAGRAGPAGAARASWPRLADLAEVYAALVLGVRDYVRKNGFGSVILGLSGGIDSALTATIAADAIGPDRVHVVLMPSRYSSDHSVTDAEDLVKRQGLHARTVPIAPMVDAFEAELEPAPAWPRRTCRPGSAA